MRTPEDYSGQTYAHLTLLSYSGKKDNNRHRLWTCQCDCGKTIDLPPCSVKSGKYTSCGCKSKKKYKDAQAGMYENFTNTYNDGDLTFEDYQYLTQQNCYLCGKWNPNRRISRRGFDIVGHGLDRIDSTKPHDRDNVQPCCWPCNNKRSNTPLPEFLEWIESIYNNRIKINNCRSLDAPAIPAIPEERSSCGAVCSVVRIF